MNDFSQHDSLTIAIISDTHTVLDERIAKVIKQTDIAVHAGDICCASVLEKMHPKLGYVFAVSGNNDHHTIWPAEQKEIVEALPDIAEIHLPGGLLAIEHGHVHGHHRPSHESLRKAHPQAKAIVYGHTHSQVCDTDQSPWVINPGAAGATRTRGGPACLVLTTNLSGHWSIEPFRFADTGV
ncbi:MAG: metallophosphatase family protein [Gammaproteobacteria bacterium]|nr:metallophosphatase family protein [Gammaproteobacteria bacterium]